MKWPRTRYEDLRRQRGYTKAELARRSGLEPQTLQRIEDGTTKTPFFETRAKIARGLDVGEHDLFAPIGTPVNPLPGETTPIDNLIYRALQDLVEGQRAMLEEMRAIRTLLQRQEH